MIELKNIRKAYENVTPLKDVSVTINKGDVISVIGPSGTGKSTLLRCINLLERPTSGQVIFDGVDITDKKCDISKIRLRMGMVFQSFNLFENMTVIENIMFPRIKLLKHTKQEAYDKAIELLRTVGLVEKALSYPSELSGGQKQRVAIARALSTDPEVILFDEPTSALDPTMVGEVQTVISRLAKTGVTMLIVTHEMNFAREVANRVFYMDDGGIYEDDKPEVIFENPKKPLTKKFIRKIRSLEIRIDDEDYDFGNAITKIEDYCYKNQVAPKIKLKTISAFEELVNSIIIKECDPNVYFNIEYINAEDSMSVEIMYGKKPFNPKDSKDELALTILKTFIKDYSYEELNENSYKNKISFNINNTLLK